jgi:hypothetical protein
MSCLVLSISLSGGVKLCTDRAQVAYGIDSSNILNDSLGIRYLIVPHMLLLQERTCIDTIPLAMLYSPDQVAAADQEPVLGHGAQPRHGGSAAARDGHQPFGIAAEACRWVACYSIVIACARAIAY